MHARRRPRANLNPNHARRPRDRCRSSVKSLRHDCGPCRVLAIRMLATRRAVEYTGRETFLGENKMTLEAMIDNLSRDEKLAYAAYMN